MEAERKITVPVIVRVSARKKFMGGTIRKHKFLHKFFAFLKDFTKMPIKKTLLQFDGGDFPPCQNHEGDKSPPLYETLIVNSCGQLISVVPIVLQYSQ